MTRNTWTYKFGKQWMTYYVAFHQGLHCSLNGQNGPSENAMQVLLGNYNMWPIDNTMDHSKFIASNYIEGRIQSSRLAYLFQSDEPFFLILGLLGGVLQFYSNFKRNHCLQTVKNLIRRRVLRRLNWFCTVCRCPTKRTLGLYGLMI